MCSLNMNNNRALNVYMASPCKVSYFFGKPVLERTTKVTGIYL